MKKNIKKIIATSVMSLLVLQVVYISFVEPSVVFALPVSDAVQVSLTVDSGISIVPAVDVVMAPNLSVSSNTSVGSATWNVKTNSAGGYTLAVKANNDPALVRSGGGTSFPDYTEAVTGTPDLWSVASGSYEFGYSVYGADRVNSPADYWGTGSSCGSGTPSTTLKYVGTQTTDKTISSRVTPTLPAGVDTTICFAAAQNGVYAPSGTYTATITATATES